MKTNQTTNQKSPKRVNLKLTSAEVLQLKNLTFNAIWYNDECNFTHQNRVLNALLIAKNESNESEISCAMQLLNTIGCMSDVLSKLNKRLKQLEAKCDRLNIS